MSLPSQRCPNSADKMWNNPYVFPPFVLIDAVLRFLLDFDIPFTIVVPAVSPCPVWWPVVFDFWDFRNAAVSIVRCGPWIVIFPCGTSCSRSDLFQSVHPVRSLTTKRLTFANGAATRGNNSTHFAAQQGNSSLQRMKRPSRSEFWTLLMLERVHRVSGKRQLWRWNYPLFSQNENPQMTFFLVDQRISWSYSLGRTRWGRTKIPGDQWQFLGLKGHSDCLNAWGTVDSIIGIFFYKIVKLAIGNRL